MEDTKMGSVPQEELKDLGSNGAVVGRIVLVNVQIF